MQTLQLLLVNSCLFNINDCHANTSLAVRLNRLQSNRTRLANLGTQFKLPIPGTPYINSCQT